MTSSTKKFCVVPWQELYSTTLGTYRMCCLEDESGTYRNDQTSITEGIENHWNSKYMKTNRLSFLKGQDLLNCKKCWKDDADGKISLRQRRNMQYLGANDAQIDPWIDHFKSITDDDGYVKCDIKGVYLSVGNTCQLKCTHCSPAYSSGVAKEYVKLKWAPNFKTRRLILDDKFLGSSKQKEFDAEAWPQLKSIAHKLKWIRCTGGEPTISRGLLEFMQWLDQENFAKDIKFYCNTNAISVSQDWITAASKFQNTELKIGLDGTDLVDHYVRYPTLWKRKIPIVMELLGKFPDSYILTTLHVMNISDFPRLLDVIKDWPGKHEIGVLDYPPELDICHMPDEFKENMIEQLSKWLVDDPDSRLSYPYLSKKAYQANGITAVINRLKKKRDPLQWTLAKSIISQYDSVRPYTLSSISPMLTPYLSE